MFDLPEKIKNRIINVLSQESRVEQAILFGSRARGDSKPNSDIDIALVGSNIPLGLSTKLRESVGIYQLDIVRIENLDDDLFVSHIMRDGIVIYDKELAASV